MAKNKRAKMIRSITLRQKAVKALQRKIKYHRDELGVHQSHLRDIQRDVSRLLEGVEEAVQALDRYYNAED